MVMLMCWSDFYVADRISSIGIDVNLECVRDQEHGLDTKLFIDLDASDTQGDMKDSLCHIVNALEKACL